MIVFDIESDGLLDEMTVVHCINAKDRSTGKVYSFNEGKYADGSPAPRDGNIQDGLNLLANAPSLAGQNIIGFDIPAIRKLYPLWSPPTALLDTQVAASVIFTTLKDLDFARLAQGRLPREFQSKGLVGRQSLEAWGYRLGEYKGDFKGPWKDFTPEMDAYGRQDIPVTDMLVDLILSKKYSSECLALEHAVAQIIFRQKAHGFAFNYVGAQALTAKLMARRAELDSTLSTVFDPWYKPKGEVIPKRDNSRYGYVAGAPLTKVEMVVFNPGSRDQIADRLMVERGWEPRAFTDTGKPQVDETILGELPWPEAQKLAEYFLVSKRLGQLAEGKEALLTNARNRGFYYPRDRATEADRWSMHGSVSTNGAVTGRMTHFQPNVAQTPRVGTPYGEEFRALYIARYGKVLVGCDAEGLELRCLAHFMAKYDNGAYSETVVNGKKEDGTDVHSVNKRAVLLNSRDSAKTFIYALIYGAGDEKLGETVYDDFTDEQKAKFNAKYPTNKGRALKALGKRRRAALMDNLPALGKLVEQVKEKARATGRLKGLDGRLLHIRAEHAALNTLLQSAGAVAMKMALVLLDKKLDVLRAQGWEIEFVANIHDEWQIECPPEVAEEVGKLAAGAITAAGEYFKFRCPLAGSYAVGSNWAETH